MNSVLSDKFGCGQTMISLFTGNVIPIRDPSNRKREGKEGMKDSGMGFFENR